MIIRLGENGCQITLGKGHADTDTDDWDITRALVTDHLAGTQYQHCSSLFMTGDACGGDAPIIRLLIYPLRHTRALEKFYHVFEIMSISRNYIQNWW